MIIRPHLKHLLVQKTKSKTTVKQYNNIGDLLRDIELPGIGSPGGFGAKQKDKEFYIGFSSSLFPSIINKYDIESEKSILHEQPKIDYDPNQFETKQVFFQTNTERKFPCSSTM